MREKTHRWQTDAMCIHIGLVNNMPDSALEATERQFRALLSEAASAEGIDVCLSLFALPEVPRSDIARCRIDASYSTVGELWNEPLDGLIVTGAEPAARNLTEEPYWAVLARLIDWAERNTHSTVWSCLAAHAAVLRLDAIERRRFESKLFGVFDCTRQIDHLLTAAIPPHIQIPHSRWNDVPSDKLSACNYQVLTRLQNGSVDAFVKQTKSLFVFLQGHPEYDADSLLLEYRRDIRRFLNKQTQRYPSMPHGYFDDDTVSAFTELSAQAVANRCEQCLANFPLQSFNVKRTWRPHAFQLYRNWLRYLFVQKSMSLGKRQKYNVNIGAPAASAGTLFEEVKA